MGAILDHFTGGKSEAEHKIRNWFGVMQQIHYDEKSGGVRMDDQGNFLTTREELQEIYDLGMKFFDYYGDETIDEYNCNRRREVDEHHNRPTKTKSNKKNYPGWIYLLRGENGLYKIGMTKRTPDQRLAEFSPKLPFDSLLVDTIESQDAVRLELEIHERFADKRVRGEWFALNQEDLNWFIHLPH